MSYGYRAMQRFRWLTSLIFSGSIALEFLTPLVPSQFLVLASLSNVGKSVGVTTYVATHPAFMRSFARGENLADINAKGQVRAGTAVERRGNYTRREHCERRPGCG